MSFQQTGTPVTFINVADRERALAFYRDTLGLPIRSSDQFGDFIDLGGALLRMTALPGWEAAKHPVLAWNVEDVAAAVAKLRERGIVFTIYDGFGQDENGIWTSPDGSKLAWFTDPDGNVLMLSEA